MTASPRRPCPISRGRATAPRRGRAPYQISMIDLAEDRVDKARLALERIGPSGPKFAQAALRTAPSTCGSGASTMPAASETSPPLWRGRTVT